MNPFDSAQPLRSAPSSVHTDSLAAASASPAADERFDVDSWLGYESIHPLTWIPVHATVENSLRGD